MSLKAECVKVAVRVRPMSPQERAGGRQEVVTIDEVAKTILISKPLGKSIEILDGKEFTFDEVFGPSCTQSAMFELTTRDIIDGVIEGFNGTIFAYGQTGAGKTHTMVGSNDSPELRGIIPRVFEYIFSRSSKLSLQATFIEIYNEEIRDLLEKRPQSGATARRGSVVDRLELQEKPDGSVGVRGLEWSRVESVSDLENLLCLGIRNRSTSSTLMNNESSRSHSIFTIFVQNGDRYGKLNLVDLAGSERQSKTGATGDTLKEAAKINLSLSALGNVISALVENGKNSSNFVPYRDSKLTRMLQDSLGGNTKTVMIANIGPVDYNYEESMSTLRYASRAKNIKNKPRLNEDPKDALIREYEQEIKRLREQLGKELNHPSGIVDSLEVDLHEELKCARREIARKEEEHVELKRGMDKERQRMASHIDEAGELRSRLEQLSSKNKSLRQEMSEMESENFQERNDLLETIREMKKIHEFNEIIVQKYLDTAILKWLEENSWFNQDTGLWVIPDYPLAEDSEFQVPLLVTRRDRPKTADRTGKRPQTSIQPLVL
jgi:hypothetical protein